MTTKPRIVVTGVVEGTLDEIVLRRILTELGATAGVVYGREGKRRLLEKLPGFNQAAQFHRWAVLIDLDGAHPCAPAARAAWLPAPASGMCLCIAVREIEAWLLADRNRFATFLHVAPSLFPTRPEDEADPKQIVVNLARRSRNRIVREELVPRPASGRAVGPAYNSRLTEFVLRVWDPREASTRSPSLDRALARLRTLCDGPFG